MTLGEVQLCCHFSQTPHRHCSKQRLKKIFHGLQDYCNVQDPNILEDLIEELGDEETKMKLNHYIKQLLTFQQETKLEGYDRKWARTHGTKLQRDNN